MNVEEVRALVCSIAKVSADQIPLAASLSGLLGGSLGRARLDAALRSRYGISNSAAYKARTYSELCSLLGGGPGDQTANDLPFASIPPQASAEMSVMQDSAVGIDLERVDSIPQADDYWEDEFCKNIFTTREIAYALLQPSPRQSLAAMWCAKEAFRKAVPAYLGADWNRIEVSHADQGKPYIVVDEKTAKGTLSLTHVGDFALAVYVAVPVPVAPQPLADELRTQPPGAPSKSGRYTQAIAVLALIFSLFASLICILR